MTLLSSFELLFEPITPKVSAPINPSPAVPDPVIVQAYFVLISNVGALSSALTLEFTSSKNDTLSLKETFQLFDVTNKNFNFEPLDFPTADPSKAKAHLPVLESGQTALFLLQPDIATLLGQLGTPPDITKANFGLRGYVDVSANVPGSSFLISPQTRGTFLDASNPMNLSIAAQEAYPLPTPDGKNLFMF
jgi:hypothetical protein